MSVIIDKMENLMKISNKCPELVSNFFDYSFKTENKFPEIDYESDYRDRFLVYPDLSPALFVFEKENQVLITTWTQIDFGYIEIFLKFCTKYGHEGYNPNKIHKLDEIRFSERGTPKAKQISSKIKSSLIRVSKLLPTKFNIREIEKAYNFIEKVCK